MARISKDLIALQETWSAKWEMALEVWSRFTKLAEPRWCLTKVDEKKEGLTDSFAMIRLVDHAVVISLRQIKALKLDKFAAEILAHEIGHHVYAPGDLRDNARLLARIRAGLPSREDAAGLIANLYTDLLINDRLQRGARLDIAAVYKKLKGGASTRLWNLISRIGEILWRLPPGELVVGKIDDGIQGDAALGARVIRAYGKEWLDGAGRFACLCLPYLLDESGKPKVIKVAGWLDTQTAGVSDEIPEGLAEIEDGELGGVIHPALDENLTGIGELEGESSSEPGADGQAIIGGRKNDYRPPDKYVELMKSIGVDLPEEDLIIHYYRERARPHLIRFPVREVQEATDPLPEGTDLWDTGSPLTDIDWVETVVRSPTVIPGLTTVKRTYGTTEGGMPERQPVDLFLGVDCSGSMMNPKYNLSYPVLAGAIIVLSALRAGARVMVTLSGEPGKHSSTDGFIRNEREILKILTGYLGTGYAFGVLRLKDAFLRGEEHKRPVHILVVTDADIFHMLKEVKNGWGIAREALQSAGGGGTYVLNLPSPGHWKPDIERMHQDGWNVHFINDWEGLMAFARAFSQAKYEKKR